MLMVQNAKGKTLWTNLLMCYCGADMSQDESHHSRCTPNLAGACLIALETSDTEDSYSRLTCLLEACSVHWEYTLSCVSILTPACSVLPISTATC